MDHTESARSTIPKRELRGICVSWLDLDLGWLWNRLFFQRITQILLYSPIAYANGAKFVKIRGVPASILDLVELSLVVANHANFTVLTQNMCELREICSACDQLLAFGVSTID